MARRSDARAPAACACASPTTRRRSTQRAHGCGDSARICRAAAAEPAGRSCALGRYRPAGRQLVDRRRQSLREFLAQILWTPARLGRELPEHAAGAEDPVDLIGGDRLIGAGGNPGARHASEPLLLELRYHSLHPAMLLNKAIYRRGHLRSDDAAQQSIQQSHDCLLQSPSRFDETAILPQVSSGAQVRGAPFYYIITETLKTRCQECGRDHEAG